MSNSDAILNPNKKASKMIPVYIILAVLLFGILGALFIITTEPQKSQQAENEQNIKETRMLKAKTVNEDDAKKMMDEQMATAKKALKRSEEEKQRQFNSFQGKRGNNSPTSPNLQTKLPGAPPPPKEYSALQTFNKELATSQRATTSPEVYDFTNPNKTGTTLGVNTTPANGTIGADRVLVQDGSEKAPTLDEKWRSPASPVNGPTKAPTQYLLQEGSIIDVVLLGNINTQNPGKVQFRVVSNVYDSLGNRHLLIPQGTKLLGRYANPSNFGIDRVPISINRAVFSDGRSIALKDTDITDAMGTSGAPSEFHSNIWRAIGPAALVAWIGFKVDEQLGTNTTASSTSNTTAAQTVSQSTIPEIQKRVLQRYGSAQPYYTKEAGSRLSIVVASDIAIPPEH